MVLHVPFWLWNCLGGGTSRKKNVNQGWDLGVIADPYGGKWDQRSTGNLLTCEISKIMCWSGVRREIR